MIANNASGTRTIRYGFAKDHVLGLTVVLANGEIIQTGCCASKTSSGYDLIYLFVGFEGTLGIVVEATIRLSGHRHATPFIQIHPFIIYSERVNVATTTDEIKRNHP
jgi:FAD/FMN-containing dehydrogenase